MKKILLLLAPLLLTSCTGGNSNIGKKEKVIVYCNHRYINYSVGYTISFLDCESCANIDTEHSLEAYILQENENGWYITGYETLKIECAHTQHEHYLITYTHN